MNRKKLKFILIPVLTILLFTAYFISKSLLNRYSMHKDAIYAGVNDFFHSENDINDYITHNQELIDIIHYDLDINIFPDEKEIEGEVIITALAEKEAERIRLNFYDNMTIENLTLNSSPVEFTHEDSGLILIPEEIPVDTFLISIKYSGTPLNIGLSSFSFKQKNGNYVVSSLNEPTYASTWFPCNDKPDDKALLDIKITNYKNYTSVSNGVLVKEIVENDRKTSHWRSRYPTSTYLISINSGVYEKISDQYISGKDTMEVSYFVFPEDVKAAEKDFYQTPEMIEVFSKMFGEYPFIREKYSIVEFLWQSGAMENQTITAIGSNFVSGYGLFKDILIHELAHHWWGNAVGPKSWKDIWLNEGFATYSEALYFEAESGASSLQSTMFNNMSFPDKRLYNPEGYLLSSTIYDKGAWVLHMLRREVGSEKFFEILRNYFEKYKYKNASSFDFKAVCEETTGGNLEQFFKQWVFEGEERIELSVEIDSENVNGKWKHRIKVSQEQNEKFEFPLDIELFSGKDGKSKKLSFRINSRDTVLIPDYSDKIEDYKVDPDHWLLAEISKE
ncbi:MAG: M1 family aminopeptidase [Rhodothermaceae bacterium]